MKVYVIITSDENGIQDEAIFSSLENAKKYLETRGTEGNPDVIKEYVHGEMEEENKVFTAIWYNKESNTHDFEGVYGSYDEAKNVVGEMGQVSNRGIDEKLG